jgi:hypothetical protein
MRWAIREPTTFMLTSHSPIPRPTQYSATAATGHEATPSPAASSSIPAAARQMPTVTPRLPPTRWTSRPATGSPDTAPADSQSRSSPSSAVDRPSSAPKAGTRLTSAAYITPFAAKAP